MNRKDIWLPKDEEVRIIPIMVEERKPIEVELEYLTKVNALTKKIHH